MSRHIKKMMVIIMVAIFSLSCTWVAFGDNNVTITKAINNKEGPGPAIYQVVTIDTVVGDALVILANAYKESMLDDNQVYFTTASSSYKIASVYVKMNKLISVELLTDGYDRKLNQAEVNLLNEKLKEFAEERSAKEEQLRKAEKAKKDQQLEKVSYNFPNLWEVQDPMGLEVTDEMLMLMKYYLQDEYDLSVDHEKVYNKKEIKIFMQESLTKLLQFDYKQIEEGKEEQHLKNYAEKIYDFFPALKERISLEKKRGMILKNEVVIEISDVIIEDKYIWEEDGQIVVLCTYLEATSDIRYDYNNMLYVYKAYLEEDKGDLKIMDLIHVIGTALPSSRH